MDYHVLHWFRHGYILNQIYQISTIDLFEGGVGIMPI